MFLWAELPDGLRRHGGRSGRLWKTRWPMCRGRISIAHGGHHNTHAAELTPWRMRNASRRAWNGMGKLFGEMPGLAKDNMEAEEVTDEECI